MGSLNMILYNLTHEVLPFYILPVSVFKQLNRKLYVCLNQHMITLECSHAVGSQLFSSLLLPLYLFLLLLFVLLRFSSSFQH